MAIHALNRQHDPARRWRQAMTLARWRARSTTAPLGLLAIALVLPLTFTGNALAAQAPVPLGDAASFGALSATGITNAGGDTVVHGDVGSSLAIDIGVTHPGFAAYGAGATPLTNAQASLGTAYLNAAAQTSTGDITGANLAGATKLPGVYNSTGAILISGPAALTLDGTGNADSVFIFQAADAGNLTVDNNATVTYTNGAQPCHVFWKVNSAFLSNSGFTFVGTILAKTQITLTDNITVEGRVFARDANVTFIHDVVNVPSTCATQAEINAAAEAAAAAAQAAANAAAAATAAANTAAANAAASAKAAADAKVAADAKAAAEKAAATAAAAAKAAVTAAAVADAKAAKAAAVKAKAAAKVAAVKAAAAKKAATKAAAAAKAASLARPARARGGFTG